MAQRSITNEPAQCPGVVGESQGIQNCDFKIRSVRRFIVFINGAALPIPFTDANIVDEATWIANLAPNSASAPDNMMLTTTLWESEQVPGEPNTVESNTGEKKDTHYNNTIINTNFANLDFISENDIIATLRDNSGSLVFFYVNLNNEIITGSDLGGNLKFFKTKRSWMGDRGAAGRTTPEINAGGFEFGEEVMGNYKIHIPNFDFDLI